MKKMKKSLVRAKFQFKLCKKRKILRPQRKIRRRSKRTRRSVENPQKIK